MWAYVYGLRCTHSWVPDEATYGAVDRRMRDSVHHINIFVFCSYLLRSGSGIIRRYGKIVMFAQWSLQLKS